MDPKEFLDRARDDFRSGRYSDALNNYEYFFDHALDNDRASHYGVKYSYCLNEWVRLGKKYPEASRRLEEKAQESLRQLLITRDPERFHDYVCISDYQGNGSLVVQKFLEYHEADSDLAGSIVRFVWDKLVLERHWSVCSNYVKNPEEMYVSAIQKFDEAMQISKDNPNFGGKAFEEQVQAWYFNDVSRLLLILGNSGRVLESNRVLAQSISDMSTRKYPELAEKISAIAP